MKIENQNNSSVSNESLLGELFLLDELTAEEESIVGGGYSSSYKNSYHGGGYHGGGYHGGGYHGGGYHGGGYHGGGYHGGGHHGGHHS